MKEMAWQFNIFFIIALTLVCDAVRLYRENGFRDNSHFYHRGDGSHAYHFNRDTPSSIYFRCVMYDKLRCCGRAILRLGGAFIETKEHNHEPDPDFVGERHFRANVLNNLADGQFLNFHDILDRERRDRRYSQKIRAGMTMRRLRGAMYRARNQSYPQPGPRTLRQLTRLLLDQRWQGLTKTSDGTDNLYAGSVTATDRSHHVLFMSQRMRNFTAQVRVIQSDGTFKSRPIVPPSSQVLVLVTPWRNCVVPLGWVLMERRTLPAYRAVFQLIKDVCPNLDPEVIITDWEYAQQTAWHEAFPNARLQGCLWHLVRAFVKKAKQLQLLRFRHELPAMMDIIRRACAICLLPRRLFLVGLGVLRAEALQEDNVIAYLLYPFFQYVEVRWIHNRRRQRWMSMFLSEIRTNNLCESHNKMLKLAVGPYRPSLWVFISALQRLENNSDLDVYNLQQGKPVRRARRVQSVYADDQIQNLSHELQHEIFRDRNAAVLNFLHAVSHLFQSAYKHHIVAEGGQQQQQQ